MAPARFFSCVVSRIRGPDPGRLLDTRHPCAWLILFCLIIWLPGVFTLPPTDRDESRFAEASKQMIESGDFVQIRNGDTARNQKPIGIYWLQVPFAAAARAAGLARLTDIWPYRLPSLLGGMLAVLGTFWAGRDLVGRRAALLAAGMLASGMVLAAETHMAKTDAMLLAASTAVMGLLARAYLSERFSAASAALLWLALGGAILIKGPVTPAIAALCIAALLAADRGSWRWLGRLRARRGVVLMLLVVLPWFVAIGVATRGKFFADSLGGDLGGKMAGGDDAHGAPFGVHFLLLAATLFPGSFVVLPALAEAWRQRRKPAIRFLLAWLVPGWLMFEAVPTKLPHYTLPLFPALCLLGANWVSEPGRPRRVLETFSKAAFGIAAVAIALGSAVLPSIVQPGWRPSVLLGLPSAMAVGVIAWVVLRERNPARALLAGVLATPLFTWALLGLELPNLTSLWIAPRVVAALRGHEPSAGKFAVIGLAEPSLVFLAGAETRLLPFGPDGASFLAEAPGRVVAVVRQALPSFAAEAARLGLEPHPFATVDGYNYSHGRRVSLTLFEGTRIK